MKHFFLILMIIVVQSCGSESPQLYYYTAKVFLSNLDSANIKRDIKYLKEFPYVVNAVFISKDEAKEKFIADGNEDWSGILDHNPLPDSYHVVIDIRKFTKKDYAHFKSDVRYKIKNCTEVTMPSILEK